MNVYERTFDVGRDGLDVEQVLHRAFALGVAESLGEDLPPGELDHLRSQVTGRYGRSLVELAYDEGRTKGRTPGPERDAAEVWSDLVESDGEPLTGPMRGGTRPARQTDLPRSIEVPSFLAGRRDDLAKLGFPDFLK